LPGNRVFRAFMPTVLRAVAIGAFFATASLARAGHPMLTEDTGTQGTGNAELELGFSWANDADDRTFVFQPQLSYGATPTLDLIVQPSWLASDLADGGSTRGFGDTNLDFKWRFFGSDPYSLAVRAGVTVATSTNDLGLPSGRTAEHVLLVATYDAAPLTLDANLGYARNPDVPGLRTNLGHLSGAALYAATDRLGLVLDLDWDSNADASKSSGPAVALVGAIYTFRPGLDVDVGYRSHLNSAAIARQWLLGVTYRGAP
jgi:hypothetical protein